MVTELPRLLAFTKVHEVSTFISKSTIVLEKCKVSPFLHSKIQGTKFDLDISQGQPRVTIRTNLVVLSHLMLNMKFQSNQPSGSEEEDFLRLPSYFQDAAYETWLKLAQQFQSWSRLKMFINIQS